MRKAPSKNSAPSKKTPHPQGKKGRSSSTITQGELLEDRKMAAADLAAAMSPTQSDIDSQIIQLPEQAETSSASNDLGTIHDTYGLTGLGQTVVVIDGGVTYDHYALGGGFGEEYRVVGGWDFAENDADPYEDAPGGLHGTHVTGIIASSDETYPGVAPETDIVALRVFNDNAGGDFTWIESALSWVHDHQDDFENPITTVNLSVGASWNSDNVPVWATLEEELQQLEEDGIFIAVSAGNGFRSSQTAGLSYPAASPYVVPVASVGATGELSGFSQRNDRVLAAPGERIFSTAPDYVKGFDGVTDDFVASSGTSMSSPYVAGAAILVRQAYGIAGVSGVTQDMIYEHLRATADDVYDPVTDQTYLRVNLDEALKQALPTDLVGDDIASAEDLGEIDSGRTISGWINSAVDRDVFTFTSQQSGTVRVATEELLDGMTVTHVGGSESGSDFTFEVIAGEQYAVEFAAGDLPGSFQTQIEFTAAPVIAPPVVEPPTAETPVTETPVTETPIAETPATNPPVAETPVAETPVTQPPVTEAPATDSPVSNAPVASPPADSGEPTIDLTTATRVATTDGVDRIEIWAGAETGIIVNGVWSTADSNNIVLDGASSQDIVTLYGTDGNEIVTVRDDYATISGDGFAITLHGAKRLNVESRGGDDAVTIYDGVGSDLLIGRKDFTILLGADGRNHRVNGFATVNVIADAGGRDVAILHDGVGDDLYRFSVDNAEMIYDGADDGVGAQRISVSSFDRVVGISDQGGTDRAEAFGSEEAYRFVGRAHASYLTGFQESHRAEGFAHVDAYASETGENTAWLYDSPEDDHLALSPDSTHLTGGYSVSVYGYTTIGALGDSGGHDTATIRDSAGDDTFVSFDGLAIMEGDSYRQVLNGYDQVTAVSLSGDDRAVIYGSNTYADDLRENGVLTQVTNPTRDHSALRFGEVELKGSLASLQQSFPESPVSLAQLAVTNHVTVAAADPLLTIGQSPELRSERIDEAVVKTEDKVASDLQLPVEARDFALGQQIDLNADLVEEVAEGELLGPGEIAAAWDSLDNGV